MIPDELIKLAILGIGTLAGYFLKDYLDRRKEAEVRRIADRRDHYRTLVLGLKAISEGQRDKEESLWFEYSFLWLYAPDPVIQSFNKLLRHLRSGGYTPEVASDVAELILAMRRDLGFERTGLLASEFQTKAK